MNQTPWAIFGTSFFILGTMLQAGCGGSTPTAPGSGSPSGGGSGTAANVTITIVGSSGSQAFSPNPAAVSANQTVAFRNSDSATHRIVADGGAFDSGNIAPGGTSASITIATNNPMPFHCMIHPSMVGGMNTGSSPGGGSGGY